MTIGTATARKDDVPHGHVAPHTTRPYVVSLDTRTLLSQWAAKTGFTIPSDSFFSELRATMRTRLASIFKSVVMLEEGEIRIALTDLLGMYDEPVISLDQAYCPFGRALHVTRAVQSDRSDAGLTSRGGTASIEEQVIALAKEIQGAAMLVDDVIFSGDLLAGTIIPLLRKHGIVITRVVAGVGIGNGVERVEAEVEAVHCVRRFDRVVDEICERDFYPGTPLSGRTLLGHEDTGMPYVLPFGDPVEWASIPGEHARTFSLGCMDDTILLYQEIEHLSSRTVTCSDLSRQVYSLPRGSEPFIAMLQNARDCLY